jgi:hypothetical protein
MRWFGALFRVSVAQDIAADVAKAEASAAREAYSAQQEDCQGECEMAAAQEHLERALTGGLDKSDVSTVQDAIARLKRARAYVRRSAQRDGRISEQFAHA